MRHAFALVPAARGAGLGTALLRAVLAEADALGLPTVLHVASDSPARRLHLRPAFRTDGTDGVPERMVRAALIKSSLVT